MERITVKMLERLCDRLNLATGSPEATYTKQADGKLKGNIGNYHLSGAYGGYQIQRIVNEGGGVKGITQGFLPKREVWNLGQAYLDGLRAAKEATDL